MIIIYDDHLREFVCNYRHPGPRRGEPRVGSGPDVAFPVDPVDPVDPLQNSQNSGRCIFEQPSYTFGVFCRKMITPKAVFEQHSHTFGHFSWSKFWF